MKELRELWEVYLICAHCGLSATRYLIDVDRMVDKTGKPIDLCLECERQESERQSRGQERYYQLEGAHLAQ